MKTVAGIDCGTNSARLLISRVEDGHLGADVAREMRITRLGQGVDRTGVLRADALERTFAALRGYTRQMEEAGVEAVRVVATSATRDAANSDDFARGVREILGVDAEVVSGEEEARLSFRGACTSLGDDVDAPILLVDIGGGSTEFVRGSRDVSAACSMDMGSVRVYERFFASLADESAGSMTPRSPEMARALREATRMIDGLITEAERQVDFGRVRSLVGVAGTVTTITAHALDLDAYDPDAIDGTRLSLAQIQRSCNWLQNADVAQRRELGFMPPGREDVIGAGALIWSRIVDRVAKARQDEGGDIGDVVTAEHDILDGITASVLER
ncbi:exopolyphosphatase [Nanchangia anserum]|uniref:Exopolyphosphatase n=1 Tax=Nanchangia anserum TaxID=2692125 RepID=A0A8I0KQG9_9ACTO|nr:exopolyphosphatase [Nanchangia anserum]